MGSLNQTFGVALGAVLRRLLVIADRREQTRLIEERVALARRRYHQLPDGQRRELRRSARRLAELRRQVAELTGSPECCRDCAERLARLSGEPLPVLAGGHCCGGEFHRIFDDVEVAALWLAGRAPRRGRVVREPRGCLYRGPLGCRLAPDDRPSLCARYLCSELTQCLARTGALDDIMTCNDVLELEMARIASMLGLDPTWPMHRSF